MFHIKGHQSAQQAAEDRTSFHFKGRLGSQYPHFLSTIGTRVLHSFQHHPSPVSHESKHSDMPHREFASRLCAGVKRTVSGPFTGRPRHRAAGGTAGGWSRSTGSPGAARSRERKTASSIRARTALSRGNSRSLALEGLCADNLRSITDLAPWESLAAFGLIDRARNRLILRGERRLWGEMHARISSRQVQLKARRWGPVSGAQGDSDLTSWESKASMP